MPASVELDDFIASGPKIFEMQFNRLVFPELLTPVTETSGLQSKIVWTHVQRINPTNMYGS